MAEYIPGVDFQAAIEKCELCQEEDAQFYCKDCRQEMCSGCKTIHLRSKVCQNHDIVSSNLGKSNRKERITIKCTTHPREIIRMYCTSCDEAVCVKCISDTKHKTHIFDELERTLYMYQDVISQSMTETKQQIADLENSLHDIDVNVKDYTEISDKTINEINNQRNQIKSDADKIADGLVDKVKKQKQQDLQLKEKEKNDVQNTLHDHNEYLQSCEGTLKSMKNFKQIQNKKPTSNQPSITRVFPQTFVSHDTKNLQEMFGQLAYSPDIKLTQKTPKQEKDQKKKTKSDDSVDCTVISTDIVTKLKPGVECYHVSAVNDKEAWWGGGKDLVLIDIHGQVQRKIKLNVRVKSVAVTSQGEVFVTEWDGTYIKKYLPDGKCVNIAGTKLYNPFTKSYKANGLCVTSQDDLLVCLYKSDYFDGKVVRMTTTGHIKQIIQKDKQLKPLFTLPSSVTENINGDVVVVNGYTITIVVVNKEGEYRYSYPDSSQSSPTMYSCRGIACDNTGCILVSDLINHRIHQLNINGRFIQFILTEQHGIQHPEGLSIDVKGQLWLCNNDGKELTIIKYRS